MAQTMIRVQHYAVHADGQLAYAGSTDARSITAASARGVHRAWVTWARRYVAENPGDYPLRTMVAELRRNPVVRMSLEPIGEPGRARVFELRRPRVLRGERHTAGSPAECPACTARAVMRGSL